jgi:hypothetical protein
LLAAPFTEHPARFKTEELLLQMRLQMPQRPARQPPSESENRHQFLDRISLSQARQDKATLDIIIDADEGWRTIRAGSLVWSHPN